MTMRTVAGSVPKRDLAGLSLFILFLFVRIQRPSSTNPLFVRFFSAFFFFFFFFGVDIEKLQELVLAELASSFSLLFLLAIFSDFLLLIVSF